MTTTSPPTPLLDHDHATELPVEHLCDLRIDLEDPYVFQTPVGTRLTYVTKHGVLTGPRIRGELLGGGGDWVVLGTDGISRLDVRGTVRTDDGVLIHYETRGVAKLPPNGRDTIAAGGRIPFETSYIRTTPRFETSDERYAWLTEHVLIGVNEFSAGHIDHRIYRVL
ncbi:DUF3237 domain-containing protein [Actinomadura sp. 3N407]|uniref:DUF3237 domain-containing protein n=1 Tax=Actinomadura sp. 3N407 TaxID=3457423 RepID=UPI003FCE933B